MRRMLLVVVTVGAVLAATGGSAAAARAPKVPAVPTRADFAVLHQLPESLPAALSPIVARGVRVVTPEGVVWVGRTYAKVCLARAFDGGGGGGGGCAYASGRRPLTAITASVTPDDVAHITQLVPDGLRHIVVGGRRWRVDNNVAVAAVPFEVGMDYLRIASTKHGAAAFGY